MVSVNDLKKGLVLKIDGDLFSVIEYQHVKPARGAAFVRVKMRNVKRGSVVDKTFRGGEKIEDVKLVKKQMQYLYAEGEDLVFMDTESYEQESIPKKAIGDALKFMKEEDIVEIAMYEGEAVTVEPPQFVVLKVTYAEPGLKGDTATNVLKPVTVETGAEVRVPIFVNEGDYIKINTQTKEYVERTKQP
jgi:elongation factor P